MLSHHSALWFLSPRDRVVVVLPCEGAQRRDHPDQSEGWDFGGCKLSLEVGGAGKWGFWKARPEVWRWRRKEKINPIMLLLEDNSILLIVWSPKISRVSVWGNGHCVNTRRWENEKTAWSFMPWLGHGWAGHGNTCSHPFFPRACLENIQGWRYESEILYIYLRAETMRCEASWQKDDKYVKEILMEGGTWATQCCEW